MSPLTNNTRLAEALETWPEWPQEIRGECIGLQALCGGLTNESFILRQRERELVLRLDNHRPFEFGIDRARERRILEALESLHVAPKLLHQDVQRHFSIFNYFPGQELRASELHSEAIYDNIYANINRIQTLTVDLPRFNYVSAVEHYCTQLAARNKAQSDPRFATFYRELKTWQNSGWHGVICHHDLRPENMIRGPDSVIFIDWEYAALGHPDFDKLALSRQRQRINDYPENAIIEQVIYWLDHLWLQLQSA